MSCVPFHGDDRLLTNDDPLVHDFLHSSKVKKYTSDHTRRPNVQKFLPHWQQFLAQNGPAETLRWLKTGKYKFINKKDAFGLMQALGLLEA